jgi:hypothetical protein
MTAVLSTVGLYLGVIILGPFVLAAGLIFQAKEEIMRYKCKGKKGGRK